MTGARAAGSEDDAGLDALRHEIDRIDASLHTLLMERGEIIDRLIAVKARGNGGSAFRPAREAAMMRRLVERHRGLLPLAAVEGIWRIIISTFTFVQAPYTVHADVSGGDAPMRDGARFHFGFTVPLRTHGSAAAVIDAVARGQGDLGLVRCRGEGPAATPASAWWDALRAPAAPKVIARLPFVERADHAAGLPLFVIAKSLVNAKTTKPLAEAAPHDVVLYCLMLPDGAASHAPTAGIVDIIDQVLTASGTSVLVAAPATFSPRDVAGAVAAGVAQSEPVPVGSHCARYQLH